SAADAAGNMASSMASFAFDTVSMTPSLRVDLATGTAHGIAEAGATVLLDHDGYAGTAALSTVAGADGVYAFAPGAMTHAGQVLSATATDIAGNASAAAMVAMPAGGSAGSDIVVADPGGTTVVGLGGNDQIIGSDEDDRIDGGQANDMLFGEGGNDILIGGPGHDALLWG